jgi:exodeoxyribonuclease VII large subunit
LSQIPLQLIPERKIYSVTELSREIKGMLEGKFPDVWVAGEVSNFRAAGSGHLYFTLKDASARLRAVCFRNQAKYLKFKPQDGISVIARGRLSVYEARGEYQLYVEYLEPAGLGALQLAFEQLKAKLAAEGLFDPARKKPLPVLPRTVGIVTSPSGAAIRDILRVLRRRFRNMNALLYPVKVQGEGAAEEIAAGIGYFGKHALADVLIVGRGGGSLEDLSAFNEEPVARAIAASRIPIISAVGHETDFTIADFIADLRAPTPSAAAELLTPDAASLCAHALRLRQRARHAVKRLLERHRRELELVRRRRVLVAPGALLAEARQRADEAMRRLRLTAAQAIERRQTRLGALTERARALDPLAVLARGYCVMRLPVTGAVVRTVGQVKPGDETEVMLHDGSAWCEVERVAPRLAQNTSREGTR